MSEFRKNTLGVKTLLKKKTLSILENIFLETTLSENTLSENTLSESTLSENTHSENTLSANTLLENTLSENTRSENTLLVIQNGKPFWDQIFFPLIVGSCW